MHKLYSKRKHKICYTVQRIKVQDLYILPCYVHSMY